LQQHAALGNGAGAAALQEGDVPMDMKLFFKGIYVYVVSVPVFIAVAATAGACVSFLDAWHWLRKKQR